MKARLRRSRTLPSTLHRLRYHPMWAHRCLHPLLLPVMILLLLWIAFVYRWLKISKTW
jgi:hypothetical protein